MSKTSSKPNKTNPVKAVVAEIKIVVAIIEEAVETKLYIGVLDFKVKMKCT